MNAAVKMVSSSVQMDITASSKVSYNRRKIDMLQGSIFLRFFCESNFSSFECNIKSNGDFLKEWAIWIGLIQLKVVNANHERPYANKML